MFYVALEFVKGGEKKLTTEMFFDIAAAQKFVVWDCHGDVTLAVSLMAYEGGSSCICVEG